MYEPQFEEDDDEDEDDEVDRLLSDQAAESLKDKNINKAGKPEEVKEMKSVDEETDQGKAVKVDNGEGIHEVAGVSSSDSDDKYSDDLKQLDKQNNEVQVATAAAATSAAIADKNLAPKKKAEAKASSAKDVLE